MHLLLTRDRHAVAGTHVAATVAGSAYGTDPSRHPDLATGIAPGAKLALMHLKGIDVDPGALVEAQRQV